MSVDPEANGEVPVPSTSLDRELAGLRDQIAGLTSENTRLLRLLELTPAQARPPGPTQTGIFDGPAAMVDAASSPGAKVDFFASMFAARSDVYAVRWENARTGRSGWMPAVRGGWRKGVAAGSREYLPLTADLLASHLSGDIDVGLYPLLDGEHGLLALDWHSGNRSVLVDHDLSGAIVGQTLATRAEDTYRALLEATAYGTRTLIETFNAAGVHVTELIIAGGLTKNALLMQIYADVTGMPLSVIGSSQGPALGSAIHAAVAAGAYPDVTEASMSMGRVDSAVYRPVPSQVAAYDELYRDYTLLHDYFGRGANEVMHRLKNRRRAALGRTRKETTE
jgi:hypothetical protein